MVPGLIPGQGTKIPQATPQSQKKEKTYLQDFFFSYLQDLKGLSTGHCSDP